MSTGLDCYIDERDDGFWYSLERWERHGPDSEYDDYGPFPTIEALKRDFSRHVNPGGFSCPDKLRDGRDFLDTWNAIPYSRS